jgi:hypothetical protein
MSQPQHVQYKDEDGDGVEVLWNYEGGWLVYEHTGFLKEMYLAKRAWIGHRCTVVHYSGREVGFVSAQHQGSNTCGWCDSGIPDEVHGVMALYNYGKEGERHDEGEVSCLRGTTVPGV